MDLKLILKGHRGLKDQYQKKHLSKYTYCDLSDKYELNHDRVRWSQPYKANFLLKFHDMKHQTHS